MAVFRPAGFAVRACWIALVFGLSAIPGKADAESRLADSRPQLRIGIAHHDLNGYGGSETGEDVSIELRGRPLSGAFWDAVFSPRLHAGANINTGGETSSLYAGFTWIIDFGSRAYASADFGGAVHNGKLKTDDPARAELGTRLLFREAVEVGLRFGERWRAGIRLDHISNANLSSRNQGITDIGVMFTREF